jgi:putative methyltransferase (TIGR04325 family)
MRTNNNIYLLHNFFRKIKKGIKKVLKKDGDNKEKEYKDYYAALEECSTEGGYENTDLCDLIAEKTKNYIEHLKEEPYVLNATNVFLVLAINTIARIFSQESININVLDFGGACGTHYFETRRFFKNDIKFKWIVVETAEMVKSAKEHTFENEELLFVDNLEKITTPIDLIHSSGALQYIPDYSWFLSKLMKFDAKFMLFNRMMFNRNDRTFITIQKSRMLDNGPGLTSKKYVEKYINQYIFYPHTTISYKEFNETLQSKYELKWSFDESTGSYKISNEDIIGKGLFYKKLPEIPSVKKDNAL